MNDLFHFAVKDMFTKSPRNAALAFWSFSRHMRGGSRMDVALANLVRS